MINIKNRLSRFKENAKNKIKNKIKNIKNGAQKFKENFSEAKSKPRSKRESLFLGFITVLGIFGVTLFAPVLTAAAKDVPKNTPKPGEVCPGQPTVLPSLQITDGVSRAAAGIGALAITSGSFIIGAVCGLIIGIGILKAQGK